MKRLYTLFVLSLCSISIFAQIKITGRVTDNLGEPLSFATIAIRNTSSGAITDLEGNFVLEVPQKGVTVDISYIGYKTHSLVVNESMLDLKIVLEDEHNSLEETVIVGFATQKKINATGAVKTIGNESLENRPLSNAVQGLQGVVAGFNITNDNGGALGEDMAINIRGVGSIGEGSNSSPLILIDGMEGDLSTLNPNDIESVSVLKEEEFSFDE